MSIGTERAMYPFELAKKCAWAEGSKIVNCSLPGFTSADAARFFFEHKNSYGNIKAVIIYLGNCDTIATELPKRRLTPFQTLRIRTDRLLAKKPRSVNLKNHLHYFDWNSDFDQSIEEPVPVSFYEHNIARVLQYCQRKGIRAVLVRPEAHIMFPAGSGKGNYIFYHYLGLNPALSQRIVFDDHRLIAGAKAYEREEYQEAADIYNEILLHSEHTQKGLEYQTLLVNNYAASRANLGHFDEAEYLMRLLLKEREVRREIMLYNLAMISKMRGDEEEFKDRLAEAYEADSSNYRVREPYKCATDRLAKRYSCVELVDMRDLLCDDDFVDHCHPLPTTQEKLAETIFRHLDIDGLRGSMPLEIENRLYNPEYYLGNEVEFYRYFKAYSEMSRNSIEDKITTLGAKLDAHEDRLGWPMEVVDELPRDLAGAFSYYKRHPMFPALFDVIQARPGWATDVGRFPEFFLFRYLVPYLKFVEGRPALNGLFSSDLGVLQRARDLRGILPADIAAKIDDTLPQLDETYMATWRQRILVAAGETLKAHLRQKNQIEARLKTTIFWYFRETLRFGPHSRISMRYERVQLEYITEALAVALVLGELTGAGTDEVRPLIRVLEDTVRTHEKFCTAYDPNQNSSDLFVRYDAALSKLASAVV